MRGVVWHGCSVVVAVDNVNIGGKVEDSYVDSIKKRIRMVW